jgi:hypothetical protein
MKIFYSILLFTFVNLIHAQDYAGVYTKNITTNSGSVIDYKLDLAPDGTYKVSVFRNLGQNISVDENFYGNGNWKVINKLIVFSCEELADKNYINLNKTTSRFDAKNKKELRFFNCPSLWFKNATLEKIN